MTKTNTFSGIGGSSVDLLAGMSRNHPNRTPCHQILNCTACQWPINLKMKMKTRGKLTSSTKGCAILNGIIHCICNPKLKQIEGFRTQNHYKHLGMYHGLGEGGNSTPMCNYITKWLWQRNRYRSFMWLCC